MADGGFFPVSEYEEITPSDVSLDDVSLYNTNDPTVNICPIIGRTSETFHINPMPGQSGGKSISVDIGQTVYGGTVDAVSGELSVTKHSIIPTSVISYVNKVHYLGKSMQFVQNYAIVSTDAKVAETYNTNARPLPGAYVADMLNIYIEPNTTRTMTFSPNDDDYKYSFTIDANTTIAKVFDIFNSLYADSVDTSIEYDSIRDAYDIYYASYIGVIRKFSISGEIGTYNVAALMSRSGTPQETRTRITNVMCSIAETVSMDYLLHGHEDIYNNDATDSRISVVTNGDDTYIYHNRNLVAVDENGNVCLCIANANKSKAEFDSWLSTNNPQIVYEPNAPETLQIDKKYITTLSGTNYVSADAGNVSVTYRTGLGALTDIDLPVLANLHYPEKKDIGLGNVDNTSDENKPISLAAQVALDGIDAHLAILDGEALGEYHEVTLTNTKKRPFNSTAQSPVTVALTQVRKNLFYTVEATVTAHTGIVGEVQITDKALNGFKVSYTGSGSNVTIALRVKGGMT